MGDFDFLAGSWDVHTRRLTKRLVGSDDWIEFTAPATSWTLFEGMANVDEIVFPGGTRGAHIAALRSGHAAVVAVLGQQRQRPAVSAGGRAVHGWPWRVLRGRHRGRHAGPRP